MLGPQTSPPIAHSCKLLHAWYSNRCRRPAGLYLCHFDGEVVLGSRDAFFISTPRASPKVKSQPSEKRSPTEHDVDRQNIANQEAPTTSDNALESPPILKSRRPNPLRTLPSKRVQAFPKEGLKPVDQRTVRPKAFRHRSLAVQSQSEGTEVEQHSRPRDLLRDANTLRRQGQTEEAIRRYKTLQIKFSASDAAALS